MQLTLLFFNMSSGEIFIILLIAFLVFGPSKIPYIAKKLGKAVYQVKRASNEIKREINAEVNKIERDNIASAKKETAKSQSEPKQAENKAEESQEESK